MFRSAQVLILALVSGAALIATRASAQSNVLATITVQVQTFGRPRADFPARIVIHSEDLGSDLSTIVDGPSDTVFPNLPPGLYNVQVTSAQLSPAQLDLALSAGQSIKLSLILDPVFPLALQFLNRDASATAAVSELPVPGFVTTRDFLLTPGLRKSLAVPSSSLGTCSLDKVLPHVTAHAREFVDNVNRITATEILELERWRSNGKLDGSTRNKVVYVANIELRDSRYLTVDEYRDGERVPEGFIKAVGSPSLVLIFHPIHVNEFAISCKGLGTWNGTPAYLVDFQQRTDRPNSMSAFVTPKGSYDVNLKGTAWVDANTFQVIHLKTDLMNPIPALFLDSEHQELDYGQVQFVQRHISLWLPRSVDISVHLGNKQFSARHSYSDYQLFSVDTGQKIDKPKESSN
ncbi:MAG TPA: hypothetical protein VMU53_20100 [Candidatus Sulfotelmatobacter sp.]|nr:hypothetical protein [Candidatus Sulfotelmatobacter sp.]